MITIEKMRTLIPDSDKYTDAELHKISQDMYALADLIFDKWLAERICGTKDVQKAN